MARTAAVLLASYLLGSVPTAYLLVKWRTGQDIRRLGSRNVGATNTARAAGAGMGVVVFLIDTAKGAMPSMLPALLWGGPSRSLRLLCGGMAVVGHVFPWALGFRGGKGVATTLGALIGSDPALAGLAAAIWALIAALFRYVSLASMVMAIGVPIGQWWLGRPVAECAMGVALGACIILRHHENLARLLAGREPRMGTRSSSAS